MLSTYGCSSSGTPRSWVGGPAFFSERATGSGVQRSKRRLRVSTDGQSLLARATELKAFRLRYIPRGEPRCQQQMPSGFRQFACSSQNVRTAVIRA